MACVIPFAPLMGVSIFTFLKLVYVYTPNDNMVILPNWLNCSYDELSLEQVDHIIICIHKLEMMLIIQLSTKERGSN